MSTTAVRPAPWIGQSHVFESSPTSIDAVLSEAGLDWDVEQRPVYYEWDGKKQEFRFAGSDKPSAFVNVRGDTGEPLGVVSERYAVLNNRPAFGWVDTALKSGELQVAAAGPLNGGKQVFLMLQVPGGLVIGGDATDMYVYVRNSHDGFRAVRGDVSAMRILCENQLPYISSNAERSFSISHLGDPAYQLQQKAQVLDITGAYAKEFKKFGDALALKPITEKQLRKVMETLWPEKEDTTERKRQNLIDKKNHIVWLWKEGETIGNAPGTAWSAANAICEFIDYGDKTEHEGKLTRAMHDPTGDKRKAISLVAGAVGVK